jgi:hypothetical protein
MIPGATTFSITAHSILTVSIKCLFAKLNINNTQHYNTLYRVPSCKVSLAECRVSLIIMLNVILLSVVMPSVVTPDTHNT